MPGPCTGLTVLDFSWGMPGALCTLVMADYGADVIKVEPPGGDPFRFQPAWISWNRGKKGIVLDLGTTEGRAQAIELIAAADVLVESFRPGDMADWGLAYDTLSQLYPRLIYCSITGFGQKGPLAPGERIRGRRCGQGRSHAQLAGTAQPRRPCVFGGAYRKLARESGGVARHHRRPARAGRLRAWAMGPDQHRPNPGLSPRQQCR